MCCEKLGLELSEREGWSHPERELSANVFVCWN